MGLFHDLLRKVHAVLFLPVFQLLRCAMICKQNHARCFVPTDHAAWWVRRLQNNVIDDCAGQVFDFVVQFASHTPAGETQALLFAFAPCGGCCCGFAVVSCHTWSSCVPGISAFLHAMPHYFVCRFVFPDLFDSLADQRSDAYHDNERSPLAPSDRSQLHDDPGTPLVSPPVLPSNSGLLGTAFDLPMPSLEDMPTPDGPLAPVSTRSYKAHGASSGGSNASGTTTAVQHICAVELSSEAETAQIQHQPTESGESLFGTRSRAGPLGDDDSDSAKLRSGSGALIRGSGGHRSIGSDLTNFDEVSSHSL